MEVCDCAVTGLRHNVELGRASFTLSFTYITVCTCVKGAGGGDMEEEESPTIRLCTWQTLEEEREAFLITVILLRYIVRVRSHYLRSFPFPSARVCSCDTTLQL